MPLSSSRPFRTERYELGPTRDGRSISLVPMTPDAAPTLGAALAAIDPWRTLEFDSSKFAAHLAISGDGTERYVVCCDGELAGAAVVRWPWLNGPYLNILGILPACQRLGLGTAVMSWFEAEGRGHAPNLWLCVSDFNAHAISFYEAHGYARAARLDDLLRDGTAEILMRKRLY
jgi:diamine N-acetyltransferase